MTEALVTHINSSVPATEESPILELSKVKIGDEIMIQYRELPCENGKKETTFTKREEARASFYEAAQALLKNVIAYVGLDSDAWEEGKIIGVTFKDDDRGEIGIVITATCVIGSATAVINTPYISPAKISENGEIGSRIYKFQQEAIAYVKGARKVEQMSLNLVGGGKLGG